jgi:hypothetical protein
MENDLLHDYVKTRAKNEVPVLMSVEEKQIWVLSANTSVLVNQTDRCLISWCLVCATLTVYALWWMRLVDGFRYYFIIDLVMFVSLSCGWRVQFFVYHTAFACATIYLQYSIFNPSLQNNDIVVHQYN